VKQRIKTWIINNKRTHWMLVPRPLLLMNFIFQRIFRINSEVKTSLHYTSCIQGFKNIKYGKGVEISFAVSGGCYIHAKEGSVITIGDNCLWSFNCSLQTANHDFYDRSKYSLGDITMGNNCWLGSNVSILAGVVLGDNVTVGANSVVTKSFPSNVVIAGCPAKIIKEL
jgi:acetyltransferase-like isoleucine patch superfamily enzyme